MNDDVSEIKYKHYIFEYGKYAAAVRKICSSPEDCSNLISDDEQIAFMRALKPLGRVLASIKESSLFNLSDINSIMSEDEYLKYKSWYFTFYDELKEKAGTEYIIQELDSNNVIARSLEKVDIEYIVAMLKHVGFLDNEETKEKNINEINREIDRTDNEQMRHKAPIMKDFINSRFANLDPVANVDEEYREFEKEALENSIVKFSEKNDLDAEFVRSVVDEYFADKQSVTKIVLRERLAEKKLPLIKQTAVINDIMAFVRDMYDKFK